MTRQAVKPRGPNDLGEVCDVVTAEESLPRSRENGDMRRSVSYIAYRSGIVHAYQRSVSLAQTLTHTDEDTSQVQGNSAWLDRHGAKAGVFEDLVLR
ncbi:MAG: hypothetical protein L6R35_003570 [Caloplaca aegaea]|nr:MAG: hypothetical protein L6R35_003570 [Caloplaca aegaea]